MNHLYEREYTPSGCSKLKVNHNCAVRTGDDKLCDQPWMDHPLKYMRKTKAAKATEIWKLMSNRPNRAMVDEQEARQR